MREFFSQFGEIVSAKSTPKNSTAVVTFSSHDDARRALEDGVELDEDCPPVEDIRHKASMNASGKI